VKSRRTALLVLAASLLALVGCGGLDAETFTEQVRQQGVGIELGRELRSEEDGVKVYDFRIAPIDSTSTEARGTIEVFDSEKAATDGWTRCLAAADLTCYRAGEIVVVLPSDGLEERRLAAAMQRLQK
jgi:hypothetical protein